MLISSYPFPSVCICITRHHDERFEFFSDCTYISVIPLQLSTLTTTIKRHPANIRNKSRDIAIKVLTRPTAGEIQVCCFGFHTDFGHFPS